MNKDNQSPDPTQSDTNSQLPANQTVYMQDIAPGAITQPTLVAGGNFKGDIYYGMDGVRFSRLPIGASAQVLTVASGVPSWSTLARQVPRLSTLSTTTPTIDTSIAEIFTITLTGSTTYSITKAVAGKVFIVEVQQGSGTTYTNTWFSGITWITSGATAPVQTTTSSGYTSYGFIAHSASTFTGYLVGQS